MSDFLENKNSLTRAYNDADTLRAGTAPGLISLVDKVTQGGQHIFFGEPHADGMLIKQYQALADNYGIFRAAAHNGVKHLALEFPSEMQSDVDDYMAGKITRDDFKKALSGGFESPWTQNEDEKNAFLENFTRTISNARSAGMSVHLADVSWREVFEDKGTPEMQAWERKLTEKYEREKPSMSLQDYAQAELDKMPKDEKEKLMKMAQDHVDSVRHRRMDDSEQYAYLRQRIPQGEGIMGVVGLSHLDNNLDEKRNHKTRGIDDYLTEEGGKVTTIEMHTSKSKEIMQDMYEATGVRAVDRPDYTVILDRKEIMSGEDIRIGRIDRPLPEQEDTRLASLKHQALPSLSN